MLHPVHPDPLYETAQYPWRFSTAPWTKTFAGHAAIHREQPLHRWPAIRISPRSDSATITSRMSLTVLRLNENHYCNLVWERRQYLFQKVDIFMILTNKLEFRIYGTRTNGEFQCRPGAITRDSPFRKATGLADAPNRYFLYSLCVLFTEAYESFVPESRSLQQAGTRVALGMAGNVYGKRRCERTGGRG